MSAELGHREGGGAGKDLRGVITDDDCLIVGYLTAFRTGSGASYTELLVCVVSDGNAATLTAKTGRSTWSRPVVW